ncbi:MAG: bifunctional alpha,alpha-trehalose-phosphate synthase (UDP-forming)/trehalose-phosphatase [Saprospirales bacterium]|nr:bifunctional alpha,alpha-trehalose-phosphate synthase (UDP-forming)/trehalose-phosphatase [Saprospirales bacterium]
MPRLIIISNRLPVTVNKKQGELIYHPSAGGLATGLNSLDETLDKIWIGWPGQALEDKWERESVKRDLAKDGLVPVFLSEEDIELYYEGFSNKVIWPHFHYFPQFTSYEDRYWAAYKEVNQKFADVVIESIEPDDIVWVHDYQLLLLPAMIREAFPDISIGFFLHIPFPSYELFRMLPWREQLLRGLLGADQIGFHTFDYMRHFLSAAYRITGYEHYFGKLPVGKRMVNTDVFPMGIDYDNYAFPDVEEDAQTGMDRIRKQTHGRKLVITIDRLDYTKGIPNRVKVFRRFLNKYPEYKTKVSLVLIVVPSRSNVDQYRDLKTEIDTLVGEFNSNYGTFDWTPILYFYRSLNFGELTTLYKVADIAMITPLRDGMNLVAKEYIAAKEESKKGVLILSEMAGAANELYDALIVNPQDINEMAEALKRALEMDEGEQRTRLEKMQLRLKKYTVKNWAEDFINEQMRHMEEQKGENTNLLTEQDIQELIETYHSAKDRLIVLDYDGTLMEFHPDPMAVVPDEELLSLLAGLKAQAGNHVVVSSGRDRDTLDKWLGPTGIDLAAEHGVWVKMANRWKSAHGVVNAWKKDIRPVLDNMVERTPGSFIEEKQYSLAWHYRMTDKDLGEKRVREFRDTLLYLTANLDLQVLEGNKVVEIKNAGVNKGKAMLNWLSERDWDFIIAIGDDHTDEDTFKVMPPKAYTIKVGMAKTAARFQLVSVGNVRALLERLV